MRLSNESQGAIMIVIKQNRPFTIGAALMLSIIGLGVGQAVLQNKADAQRAEAQGYVLNAAEGEHLILRGGNIFIKVDPSRGSNNLAVGTQQIPVDGLIPVHRHVRMDEFFYVVEGSGTFVLNDARLSFEKGDTVFIPKGAWHGFEKSNKERLLVWGVTPPGLEDQFRTMASRPGEPPKQLSREQLNEIAQKWTEFK
jgi:mannose-6-phosphate isomerase-like protein (cupin superfamily)